MSIFKFEDWIVKPRYYCGFPVSRQRGVWLDKIAKIAKELVDKLDLEKMIDSVERDDEKYWTTQYFSLTVRRDPVKGEQDKIVLIFEWMARKNRWRTPGFCYVAPYGSNNFTPSAATGKPIQLARFAELILRTHRDLSQSMTLTPGLNMR